MYILYIIESDFYFMKIEELFDHFLEKLSCKLINLFSITFHLKNWCIAHDDHVQVTMVTM